MNQRDTQINIFILKWHINQHNYLKGTCTWINKRLLDLIITGTYAVTMSVFWFANFFLLIIEITKWPQCLIKYKIQEEPVNEASELEPNSLSKLKNSNAEELNAWSRQMKLLRLYTNESYSCQRQVEYY